MSAHKKRLTPATTLSREAANFTLEDNQIGRRVMKQKNDPNSPLFSWSCQSIEKAIKGVQSTKEEASPQKEYPLHLRGVPDWLAPILSKVQHSLITSGFLSGKEKFGKTALALLLAMAYSRWPVAIVTTDTHIASKMLEVGGCDDDVAVWSIGLHPHGTSQLPQEVCCRYC
eukprot:6478348-Amphidinium_carterae.1